MLKEMILETIKVLKEEKEKYENNHIIILKIMNCIDSLESEFKDLIDYHIWSELDNYYYDDIEKCICIDGYFKDKDEGVVIAKVYRDRVEFIDWRAEFNEEAQIYIKEAIEEIKKI